MITEEIKKAHWESQSPNDDTLKDMFESQMESHTEVTIKAVIKELNNLYAQKFEAFDEDMFYAIEASEVKERIETLKQELKQLEERK